MTTETMPKDERERRQLTEHLWYYADDENMNVLTGDGLKSAIYIKNEDLKKMGLTDYEMDLIKRLRLLRDKIITAKNDDEREQATQEYIDEIESWELEYQREIEENRKKETSIVKPDQKKELVIEKGEFTSIAREFDIPADLANMFFMKFEDQLYIKVAGLQYIAGKKGYRRIEISDSYDEGTQTWIAEARVFPKITKELIDSVAKLSPEVQKMIIDEISKPTIGIGTANKDNVRNTKMHPFLREMAQTRALGRALRAYTGYGSTTYEELPNASLSPDEVKA